VGNPKFCGIPYGLENTINLLMLCWLKRGQCVLVGFDNYAGDVDKSVNDWGVKYGSEKKSSGHLISHLKRSTHTDLYNIYIHSLANIM